MTKTYVGSPPPGACEHGSTCEAHVAKTKPTVRQKKFASRPLGCRLGIHSHYRHTIARDYRNEEELTNPLDTVPIDGDMPSPSNSRTCLVCGHVWAYKY